METIASQVAHWVTLGGVLVLLGFAVKQHKIWIRMKDRVNSLWRKHCKEINEEFVPLENGR